MNCKNMKKISLVATKDINNKPNMAQACLNKSRSRRSQTPPTHPPASHPMEQSKQSDPRVRARKRATKHSCSAPR